MSRKARTTSSQHAAHRPDRIRKGILEAAMMVAAETPWETVALLEIARAANVSLDELRCHFYTKSDIVDAIIDDLDTQVEAAFPAYDPAIPVRDRLFDVLMERIDLANQDRAAHVSFWKSFGWKKEASCADIKLLRASMTRMARCAGLDTDGLFGTLRVAGLSLAYAWVLMTWARDTSPDLAKTMAELDRTLGCVDKAAAYLNI